MLDGISALGLSGTRPPENLSPEDAKKFKEYMERFKAMMTKAFFTKDDIEELKRLMLLINGLSGIDNTSSGSDKDIIFSLLKAAGIDPHSPTPSDPEQLQKLLDKLKALPDIKFEIPPGSGVKFTLDQLFELALDPERVKASSQNLADMLLNISNEIYTRYAETVAKLVTQVEAATQVINDLKALLDILKRVKVKYPEDFKLDPKDWKGWEDIPNGLREIMAKNNPGTGWFQKENGEWDHEHGFENVKAHFANENNKGKYVEYCEAYFKTELGVVPDIQPGDITQLLKMRDDIRKQLKELPDDDKEGSAASALKKVLEDLDKRFPPPPDGKYDSSVDFEKDPEAKKRIEEFIMAGQGYVREGSGWKKAPTSTKNVFELINDAIAANQFLSQKLSDDIKEKNVFLSTLYDMITQAMKAIDKMAQTMGRGIAR